MVRLKGGCRHCCTDCAAISIPYGAIKRCRRANEIYDREAFQFHMVRLKEYKVLLNHDTCDLISIPYGAIKSRKEEDTEKINKSNFNSIWCD